MAPINSASGLGGDHAFDGGFFFRVEFRREAHPGHGPLLLRGAEDGDLIVVCSAQGEVVEAARGDPVRAVERRHVGAAQGEIAADDRLHLVIAKDEIAHDSIGFLAPGQLGLCGGRDFESFRFRKCVGEQEAGARQHGQGTGNAGVGGESHPPFQAWTAPERKAACSSHPLFTDLPSEKSDCPSR